MRFGIQTGPQDVSWPELLAVWQRAEKLGFDSAWNFDHLVPLLIPPDRPVLEAWTLLGALAARTERLQIGCMVSSNTFRPPALLAKMAATVDQVSGGRLALGLGSGYYDAEHRAYGIRLPGEHEKAAMLDEACQVLKGLFAGGPCTFAGEHYRLEEAPFAPLPVRPGGPPLAIGGRGERLTFPIVARYADIWNLAGGSTAEDFAQKWAALRERCGEVGRDPDEIETNMAVLTFVDRVHARAAERARACARYLGLPEEVADSAFIAGDPTAVAERIRGLEEVGVRHFVVTLVNGANYDDVELFATDVVARWR